MECQQLRRSHVRDAGYSVGGAFSGRVRYRVECATLPTLPQLIGYFVPLYRDKISQRHKTRK